MMHAFGINPGKMEKIKAVQKSPKWKPAHQTDIPKDKTEA
jgi:hypothetical protein